MAVAAMLFERSNGRKAPLTGWTLMLLAMQRAELALEYVVPTIGWVISCRAKRGFVVVDVHAALARANSARRWRSALAFRMGSAVNKRALSCSIGRRSSEILPA
jgi:hypothetical protein